MLLVDRPRLSVEIGLVAVRVEDLDFVKPHQVNAAVAASLAGPLDLGGSRPLDVQLAIAERLFRADVVLAADGIAVADLPVLAPLPLRQILAVEQHDGVGRMSADRARIDDLRLQPLDPALVFMGGHQQDARSNQIRRTTADRNAEPTA